MSREKLSDSPLKKVVWQAVIDGPLGECLKFCVCPKFIT